MNIFILDNDPALAAMQQCDKHVVKMIVESAQMLSTAHRMLDGRLTKRLSGSGKRMVSCYVMDDRREDVIMKAVHFNHPCTKWTMESSGNYRWHWTHLRALCREYTHRYDKTHRVETERLKILKKPPDNIPRGSLTPFRLAMKDCPECAALGDPVEAYRAFYQTKQDRFPMVWTRREVPEWFNFKETN